VNAPDSQLPERVARGLAQHLDATSVPPPDLGAVRSRGRAARTRRRLVATGALAAVGVVAAGLADTYPWGDERDAAREPIFVGRLDLSEGLRAYAEPGGVTSLGGRELPADVLEGIDGLDTDAVATPYGVVFFDRGRPHLLGEDGTVELLVDGLAPAPDDFRPTAKADAVEPWVAWVVLEEDGAHLQVYDLERRRTVATDDVTCGAEDCSDVVVEGVDSGTVFLRTSEATWMWSVEEGTFTELAGPRTRVADVRNRVVLFTGPAPTLPLSAWRYLRGPIDAQLSFDGHHVLSWSATLEPTGEDEPLVLDVPKGTLFFTFDTDGSVLAATLGPTARFFDCALPSGTCEPLGELETTGGDPVFMGNDM
jgi:hypothetical protein